MCDKIKKNPMPGDSKWPFSSPSWRSLNPWKGHLTIPKRSQRIAWWPMFQNGNPFWGTFLFPNHCVTISSQRISACICSYQQMVNRWFGAPVVWDSRQLPLSNNPCIYIIIYIYIHNPFHKGSPEIQTTNKLFADHRLNKLIPLRSWTARTWKFSPALKGKDRFPSISFAGASCWFWGVTYLSNLSWLAHFFVLWILLAQWLFKWQKPNRETW